MKSILSLVAVSAILTPAASAFGLEVLFVTDSTNDKVYRCEDLNNDNDYNDPGEITEWYSDAIGPFVLTNNVGIASGADGVVYVSDTSEDSVFAFRDYNNDGDALDDGEPTRFYDGRAGGNADGTLLLSANSLVYDFNTGAVYAASANTGTTPPDAVLRLKDLNGDGDANDPGESSYYWLPVQSPLVTGDYLPTATAIGGDGNVYYCENGSTGVIPRGFYKLVDLNADGDANDPGERVPFFLPPAGAATTFLWSLAYGPDGYFYGADNGNEIVWRFKDLNNDGDAQDPGESSAYWTVGAPSIIWDIAIAANGDVYVTDSNTPQRLFVLRDTNTNGVIDAGEAIEIYNETLGAVVIGNARGIDLRGPQAAGVSFCYGDGTGAACPCGNVGSPGKGCANSIVANGARIATEGTASLSADLVTLIGTGMPDSSALYFQGTTQQTGGLGATFGDGLRCAGGSVIRLGTKANTLGTSRFPSVGDQPIATKGLVFAPGTRTYQIWYRNAAAFCNPETFNLSNGVQVTWTP
jgi:hypothetical protein